MALGSALGISTQVVFFRVLTSRAIFSLPVNYLRRNNVTLNRLIQTVAATAVCGMLAACATTEPHLDASGSRPTGARAREQQQLKFQLASGVYRCELGQRVEIQRDARNANLIELNWQGSRHTLQRYDSTSGLPRYEDRKNGLLWIDLPWKSVLMDVNCGRPLANECKAAQGKAAAGRQSMTSG